MTKIRKRPNILMFIPHDAGDHLRCYGHKKVKSPNLDKLADAGVKFTNFFTAAPECTPSRAGLYTGLYTHQNGLMGLTHRGWEFNKGSTHLAKYLWDAGYQTCQFGIQHETRMSPAELGYNQIYAKQERDCFSICEEAAQWLTHQAPHEQKPWFACIGLRDTHRIFRPAKDFRPDDVEVPVYLPDTAEVRADLADFYQAVYDVDMSIGKVIDALDNSAMAEDTIVVYTVDHGIPFPRAKATYYDPGIKVSMIMRGEKYFPAGKSCDELISNLDYTPTILELCGIPVPEGLEGRSFKALLEGETYQERDTVYGAFYYDAKYDPMCYVRTKKFKYIRSFALTPEDAADIPSEVLAEHKTGTWIRADDSDVQRSAAWQMIKKHGPFPLPPAEELYDLNKDPGEWNNLADDVHYSAVLAELRNKLETFMKQTDSPLFDGKHVSPALSSSGNKDLEE
jgi:arylsulfatase A-like enzyme